MQQYGNRQILYLPSDLVTFLGCQHAGFLDVKALRDEMKTTKAKIETEKS
jgi:hypothetical protein